MTLLEDRLAAVKDLKLTVGSHPAPDGDTPVAFCLLEKHAHITGQKWSDSPPNCCPTIAAFGRRINDRGSQATRDTVDAWWVENIDRVEATATDGCRQERGYIGTDIVMRTVLPRRLDAAKKPELAEQCRALAPVVDAETARAAVKLAREIRKELPEYWRWRAELRERFLVAFKEAMKNKPDTDADTAAVAAADTAAVADADTAAVADTDAVAAAVAAAVAVADTDTAAVAAAAADTAADADTDADTDAAAVAVAAAVAAAVADTAADADTAATYSSRYWAVYNAVYPIFKERYVTIVGEPVDPIEILERMVSVGERDLVKVAA